MKILKSLTPTSDKEKQDMHLSSLIILNSVQTRKPRQNRGFAAYYKIKHGTFDKTICQEAFCSHYGLGKRRVDECLQKDFDKQPWET